MIKIVVFLLKPRVGDGDVVEKPYLPYSKKPYFLTNNEREFFAKIEKIIENRYSVFPQVHYCKIIYAEGRQNFKNPWFNKIDRKSADFVLFDKNTISPVLVIEIDDSSHNRTDRRERDVFINSVLEKCGIPIIHSTVNRWNGI